MTMQQFKNLSEKETPQSYRTAYVELCNSYHRLKDFRAKLLGLLPLASGTGIFLLLDPDMDRQHLTAAGFFGLVITIGLYVYERHGTQLLDKLFVAGKAMERTLLNDELQGQFLVRPDKGVGSSQGAKVAALVVYSAVAAGWFYIMVIGFCT